tara:strand:+ start:1291 stop:1878 length:588 start_codon:yes stop_codon:yes gene_type:complete
MSFRTELKIKINYKNLSSFRAWLTKNNLIEIYPRRVVSSVYYDNRNLQMYNESIEGITPRKKIRIRHYPLDKKKTFFLEEKLSSVEGRYKTKKNIKLINSKHPNFIKDKDYGLCDKIIKIEYYREYFGSDQFRITLDTDIQYQGFLVKKRNKGKINKIAVEIKTDYNYPIDKLLNDLPFEYIRFSKYCEAIDCIC